MVNIILVLGVFDGPDLFWGRAVGNKDGLLGELGVASWFVGRGVGGRWLAGWAWLW